MFFFHPKAKKEAETKHQICVVKKESGLDIINAWNLNQVRDVSSDRLQPPNTPHGPIQSDLGRKLQLGASPFTRADRKASDENLGQEK